MVESDGRPMRPRDSLQSEEMLHRCEQFPGRLGVRPEMVVIERLHALCKTDLILLEQGAQHVAPSCSFSSPGVSSAMSQAVRIGVVMRRFPTCMTCSGAVLRLKTRIFRPCESAR